MENSKDSNDKKEEIRDEGREKINNVQKSAPAPSNKLNVPQNVITYIDLGLGMVKLLDYVVEENFEFVFQDKMLDGYKAKLFDRFMGDEEKNIPPLMQSPAVDYVKNEYKKRGIWEKVLKIKEASEKVALDNGIKKPLMKRMSRVNLIIYIAAFALLIGLNFIPGASDYSLYLYMAVMLVMCTVPQVVQRKFKKSWNDFKVHNKEAVDQEQSENIADVKDFIQILIDDTRDFCVENKIPLQLAKLDLLSNDYHTLKLVKEDIRNEQVVYHFELKYPPGMKPFEIPTQMGVGSSNHDVGKASQIDMEIPDDDENDLFIVVTHASYNDDGTLKSETIDYADSKKKELIEDLLEFSDFSSVEDPDKIIPDFESAEMIKCGCETPVKLLGLKEAINSKYPGFKFYFGIARKCGECNNNPFILFAKENSEVPDDLKAIFNQ